MDGLCEDIAGMMVVSDKTVELGKRFCNEYVKFSHDNNWDERHKKLTAGNPPSLDDLRKLWRTESQDIANAMHICTKMFILKHALDAIDGPETDYWPSFFERYFNPDGSADVVGEMDKIHYPRLNDIENQIILRLAMLEHTRWNAAHELMGYRYSETSTSCDERTMMHNCLCPWDNLDKKSEDSSSPDWKCDYKKYDFLVIDTTLAIFKEEKDKQL